MKHATPDSIITIEPLLERIRVMPGLVERKPGIYYRKSKAFLHFHEDKSLLFADVRLAGKEFQRHPVNSDKEQKDFISKIRSCLDSA